MKRKPSALPRRSVGGRLTAFVLALVCAASLRCLAQTKVSASLGDFVGTYTERTNKKSVRVLERDRQLIVESADGLAFAAFHLEQALPGDVFETVETSSHQEVSFFRDKSGKVAGLKFGAATYFRDAGTSSDAPSASASSTGPLSSPAPFPGPPPPRVRQELRGKTGDFADSSGKDVFVILERSGRLYLHDSSGSDHLLSALSFIKKDESTTSFTFATAETDGGWVLGFEQHSAAPIWEIATQLGAYRRLPYSVPTGSTSINIVKPLKGLKQIRGDALAATPPEEKGPFRQSDLVELAPLDPAIHLDIRYATPNDFLGAAVYTQARAFLQRPAAEAVLRALHRLEPLGYGLLIHDGYRPWYVTKIFWDATPESGKIFVADPEQGSRHNRGCAVDLTLYDLKTNEPVEMTSLYDEMSPRAFPDYSGGTSLQRWHRDLLRWAMESEGFTVYEAEWWHFDYQDWREYAIGNVPFEKLNAGNN